MRKIFSYYAPQYKSQNEGEVRAKVKIKSKVEMGNDFAESLNVEKTLNIKTTVKMQSPD